MTNSPSLAVVIMAPGVLLWALLGWILWRTRARRVPGATRVVLVSGVGANAYPVARAAGAEVPQWALVPGLAVALVVGYGYMLYQLRKHRTTIHGPWPEDPHTVSRREERQRIREHYRAVVARMDNMTDSDRAGVDAPARDETEQR